MFDSDSLSTDSFDTDSMEFGGGEDVPGQAGETDASDRVIRQSSVLSLVRRAAFIVFLLLLGAH